MTKQTPPIKPKSKVCKTLVRINTRFRQCLSVLQTDTNTNANSVDPDETAYYEPSHQDLHCLPVCSVYRQTPICNNRHIQIRMEGSTSGIQGVKELSQSV